MAGVTDKAPPWFALRTLHGDPIAVGDLTITPQSLALTLRLPRVGFAWQRPVAVLVRRGGAVARLPIRDGTRLAQLALLGGGILLGLAGSAAARKRKERTA